MDTADVLDPADIAAHVCIVIPEPPLLALAVGLTLPPSPKDGTRPTPPSRRPVEFAMMRYAVRTQSAVQRRREAVVLKKRRHYVILHDLFAPSLPTPDVPMLVLQE